jgi:hypothetical protein
MPLSAAVVTHWDKTNREPSEMSQYPVKSYSGRTVNVWHPIQPYWNREYQCHHQSEVMFTALNESKLDAATVMLATIGCLDALDSIPAGSTKSGGNWGQPIQRYVDRNTMHWTPEDRAERDAAFERLIAEVVASAE